MSRRVQTGYRIAVPKETEKLSDEEPKPVEDGYKDRLAAYIPAEIVGLYLTLTGIVAQADYRALTALWVIFVICLILTPVYFFFASRDKEFNKGPLIPQVVLATLAFPVWVFAIGGPFASFPWYEKWIASGVLMVVTVAFGFYKPKPQA